MANRVAKTKRHLGLGDTLEQIWGTFDLVEDKVILVAFGHLRVFRKYNFQKGASSTLVSHFL